MKDSASACNTKRKSFKLISLISPFRFLTRQQIKVHFPERFIFLYHILLQFLVRVFAYYALDLDCLLEPVAYHNVKAHSHNNSLC